MDTEFLTYHERPRLENASMILGFSGWMNGGEVSTGAVEYLVQRLKAERLAEISPSHFQISNFPGSMEVSALFRPSTRIDEGRVTYYSEPNNRFYCSPAHNLVLFAGKEPNLHWEEFADCIFNVVQECNVKRIIFVGSVAGLVPHNRQSTIYSSVSDDSLRYIFERFDLKPSNYEGPASFVTYLTVLSQERGIHMASLVSEIPAYINGMNHKCIAATMTKVVSILKLNIDLSDLKRRGREFEKRVNDIVIRRPDLGVVIDKLDAQYDEDFSQEDNEHLKSWFENQDFDFDI